MKQMQNGKKKIKCFFLLSSNVGQILKSSIMINFTEQSLYTLNPSQLTHDLGFPFQMYPQKIPTQNCIGCFIIDNVYFLIFVRNRHRNHHVGQ